MIATGYKLFKLKQGQLYPLYVLASQPFPLHTWLKAQEGPKATDGKHVASKLGPLAYRPGFHLTDLPYCSHIGKKLSDGTLGQTKDTVWCQVSYRTDIDYQPEANKAGTNKQGKLIPRLAQLDHLPVNGFYHYKTNPNMTGSWIISGEMRIERILSRQEVEQICHASGIEPQPMAE